jgi:hypothetical protein
VNQRDASGNWNKIYGLANRFQRLGYHLSHQHKFIEETATVPGVAWMFYFKVPTGNCDEGSGSDGIDYGFAAAFEKSYKRLHAYLNMGYYVSSGINIWTVSSITSIFRDGRIGVQHIEACLRRCAGSWRDADHEGDGKVGVGQLSPRSDHRVSGLSQGAYGWSGLYMAGWIR